MQFLSGEWHKDLPEVIAFIKKARDPEIVSALNIQPRPDSAIGAERIEYISRLLSLIGLKFQKPEQKMIDGVRQRVYCISDELINNPDRLAVLEAIDKKMTLWMAEKSQIDWSEQPLDQRIQEPMAGWMPEQAVEEPIQSPSNAGTSLLHTTPPTANQIDSQRLQLPDLEFVDVSEWMTTESLQCTAEYLEAVATAEENKGVERLKDVRACMPSEALKAAANLLPKPLRNRIAEMVRSMNTPVEIKPTSEQKPVAVTSHVPQVTKINKPPTPPLSKEEEAFTEWSQLHNLIKIANEFLTPLSRILHDQAIEKIKHLLTFIPSKAVALAAGTLTGDIRHIIKQLLLGFNIAID